MLLVVDSNDELVLIRLHGNLDNVIEGAIRLGLGEVDGEDQDPQIKFL